MLLEVIVKNLSITVYFIFVLTLGPFFVFYSTCVSLQDKILHIILCV